MLIESFPSGPFETNAYVVACPKTRQAAIIDPAPESFAKVDAYLQTKQLIPTKILLTHSHWDHLADVSLFKKKYNIPVYIHPLDKGNMERPGSDGLPCWIRIDAVKSDFDIHEGDLVDIGNLKLKVIDTPGHTPGGVCFYSAEDGVLISGDTLFKGSIGNLSFPTARPELMWLSLDKLAKLPPETLVYPGHGPSTTLGAEKWLSNPKKYFS